MAYKNNQGGIHCMQMSMMEKYENSLATGKVVSLSLISSIIWPNDECRLVSSIQASKRLFGWSHLHGVNEFAKEFPL